MRINRVSFNTNNVSFTAKNNPHKLSSVYPEETKKLQLYMAGLAVIGAAAVGYSIVKKYNPESIKKLKYKITDFKNLLLNKPATDDLTKLVEKKRGQDAVQIYKSYRAEKKLQSFKTKLLNGNFDGKPQEVFNHLRKNEQNLRLQAGLVA